MQINATAFSLNTAYQTHKRGLETAMARLASGDRFYVLGEEKASDLSLSERFRNRIRSADASTTSIQTANAFLDTTEQFSQTVTNLIQRMQELASGAADGLKSDADRNALEAEFQSVKSEITNMTRQGLFFGKQSIGRDVMASYDAISDRMRFWQSTGEDPQEIERDFSSTALDAQGNVIGFSSSEAYTMNGDGKSLFFLSYVTGDPGGTVRVKRYDIENHTVYTGGQTFSTGDTMFVDEDGDLYVNGSGTLYTVASDSLDRTATLLTDLRTGIDFSVYKDKAYYSRTADSAITEGNISGGGTTALTGALVYGVGVDHTIASSGKYAAEEVAAGDIRVIDTRSGNEATISLGAGTAVNNIQFNADGDRIYYINNDTNAIHYINVGTDLDGNVQLSTGEKVVQGVNINSFNGLDLGGVNYGSSIKYVLAQDTASVLSYEAVDLRLYNIGLANTHIDTYAAATSALDDLKTAMNRVSAERAKTGAMASRFNYVLESHQSYIANLKNIESQIRDVNVALESTRFSTEQVKQSVAAAIIAQFNTLSKNVLALLNG